MPLATVGVCCLLVALLAPTTLAQTPVRGPNSKKQAERRGPPELRPVALPKPKSVGQSPDSSPVVDAQPAKTTIDVAARRRLSESIKRTRMAQASRQSQQSPDGTPSALRGDRSFKRLSLSQAENEKIGSHSFTQGSRQLSPSRLSSSAGVIEQAGSLVFVFFAPNYVILFGVRYPISNGRITFDGRQFVVCHYSLALATEYVCCGDHLFPTFSGDPNLGCCGEVFFNPTTDICCQDGVYPRFSDQGTIQECCGATFYRHVEEICCSSEPFVSSTTGCCGGTAYFFSEFCCRGDLLYAIGSAICGGGTSCVDSNTTACCGDNRYQKLPGHLCCGSIYYSPLFYTCCTNGEVVSRSQSCAGNSNACSHPSKQCCLSNVYHRIAGYVCCGSTYINPSQYGCCGSTPYAYGSQHCCQNSAVKPTSDPCFDSNPCLSASHNLISHPYCCGTTYINNNIQGCCNGVSFFTNNYQCCLDGTIRLRSENCFFTDPCSSGAVRCCNGSPLHNYLFHCCAERTPFNSITERCCGTGVVIAKSSSCAAVYRK